MPKFHLGARWKAILAWTVGVGGILLLAGALGLAGLLAWFSRDLPDPNSLMQRDVAQSTRIYDRTGQTLLYEIPSDERRTLVKIQDIPDIAKWATISVEDKTFYTHHGVNLPRLVKAVLVDIVTRRKAQGASTLTQQLIKNAVLTNEKSLERKLKEIVLALQIERLYTKDQILQLYFNEIPYGSNIYGIESASETYFGKHVKDLTLDEAALLAAIPQSPDIYNPYGAGTRGDYRDKLVARQRMILDLMADQGYITKEQAAAAKQITTLDKLVPRNIGSINAPHFVTDVRAELTQKYGQRVAEKGGLKVITTLDWNMQQIAQDEVLKGVNERGPKYNFNNGALVAIDPKTGQVLAMVGSKNFWDKDIQGQVNVALSPRQPGSSFKPIVYVAGFMKGYTPEMTLWDVNTIFKTDSGDYEPKNYNLNEIGPVSARMALQGSLNIPAVKMLYLVGVGRVLDFAKDLGYTTLSDRSRFGLALVLGGGEVKLLEHTHTYATFANTGVQMPMSEILRVEDPQGKVLEEWQPSPGRQVVEQNAVERLTDVLSDNNARAYVFGTKNFLTLPGRQVAAKTGTTNNFHDAWTMGYTPSLAAGVWVGNNNNAAMKRGADGSQIAAPIWQGFMTRALANTPVETFPKPPATTVTKPILLGKATETTVKIDKVSGKLATEFTPPNLIEERTYHEAHSELWYLDKDDPLGPPPSNPNSDPQYASWEAAVQDWVKRKNWNTTSTPPTESDDVHTPTAKPQVSILAPQQNDSVTTRTPTVNISLQSQRTITHLEVVLDGRLIGSLLGYSPTIQTTIPETVAPGYHDLTVSATDDVGNTGNATVTINLSSEAVLQSKASITAPFNSTRLTASSFPVAVQLKVVNPTALDHLDVYSEDTVTGNTQLISSINSPTLTDLTVNWGAAPVPGVYNIYPLLAPKGGGSLRGDSVQITIDSSAQ